MKKNLSKYEREFLEQYNAKKQEIEKEDKPNSFFDILFGNAKRQQERHKDASKRKDPIGSLFISQSSIERILKEETDLYPRTGELRLQSARVELDGFFGAIDTPKQDKSVKIYLAK